jgi:hypothetical protein
MTSRREQIRARLEKVNEKLTRRESLDGPDWQAYAENAPFDLAYLLAELDAGEALRSRLETALNEAIDAYAYATKYNHREWHLDDDDPETCPSCLARRAKLDEWNAALVPPVGAVPGTQEP